MIGVRHGEAHTRRRVSSRIGPCLQSSKRAKYQWLDFAKVSPFFLCIHGLETILPIPLILKNSRCSAGFSHRKGRFRKASGFPFTPQRMATKH